MATGEIDTAQISWSDSAFVSSGTGTWDMTWEAPMSLKNSEVRLLCALAKLFIDIDLFETLMSELGIDEDAALAAAFRGRHG